jgi:hypothetical protein
MNAEKVASFKERMLAYWTREETDRALISVMSQTRYKTPYAGHQYYNAEGSHQKMLAEIGHTKYFGEAMAAFLPYFGTAGVAEYTGCRATRTPETTWFDPWMEDEPDASRIGYTHPEPFEKQKQAIRELIRLSKGDYPVSVSDNCGMLDALAAIRGSENLMMDMLSEPEFVEEAVRRLVDIYKQTQEELFTLTYENNEGAVQSWMQLWAPKRMAQMQCDLSVMISQDMFNRYAMPELEELSAFLDYPVYHLDGQEQIRHLDALLSIKKLRAIQWTHVAGQPKPSMFIPVLKKIQQAGKNLILIPTADEVPVLLDNLSSRGLHLLIADVTTVEEAQDLMALIKKRSAVRD